MTNKKSLKITAHNIKNNKESIIYQKQIYNGESWLKALYVLWCYRKSGAGLITLVWR